MGVLLVEQHVRQALTVADRVYVVQRGKIVMSGTAAEVAGNIEEVERAYLSGVVEAITEQPGARLSGAGFPFPHAS